MTVRTIPARVLDVDAASPPPHYHRRDLDGLYRQLIGYGRHPDMLPRLFRLLPGALRHVVGARPHVRAAAVAPDFPAGVWNRPRTRRWHP